MKVALNTESVYFEMSAKAWKRYIELSGKDIYFISTYTNTEVAVDESDDRWQDATPKVYNENNELVTFEPNRTDLALIQTIEELGEAAHTDWCKFKIIEIPDDVKWHIVSDYDGEYEYIEEVHRIWR